MKQSNFVRYSTNYRKIMDSNRRRRNFNNSIRKNSDDFLVQSKNKYIPVVTGFLRRSTILMKVTNQFYIITSRADYAAYVWDNAKDIWRREWFVKVAKVQRNMKRWTNTIMREYFK